MPDSTNINICKGCGQYYCTECSNANNWNDYCSVECENENRKD